MARTDTDTPLASVVIPVYNDPEGVATTLRAVTTQTLDPSAYEVLAVDNGSTDATRDVIRAVQSRHPDLVTLVVEDEVQGSYAARNAGIERATGEVLAFVDADMTVDRTWLSRIVDAVLEAGHDYVGCNVEMVSSRPDTAVAAYNREVEFPVAQYLENGHFAPTCCLAVHARVFDAVGDFDERLVSSGDAEFGKRVHEAGFDQHFEPSITMYHPVRSTTELLRKYRRIGRGFAQRRRLHPDRFDHRPLADPRNYLPTLSPTQLHESARTVQEEADESVGVRELVVFYVLEYLTSMAVLVGRLDHRLRERWSETVDVREPQKT